VEKIRRDVRERLVIGTKREAVVHFFAERGIPLTFVGGEATGMISATGCAPAGCGSDAALIGLRGRVDATGTVVSVPVVVSLYADCL
jgi:hypothetical protein